MLETISRISKLFPKEFLFGCASYKLKIESWNQLKAICSIPHVCLALNWVILWEFTTALARVLFWQVYGTQPEWGAKHLQVHRLSYICIAELTCLREEP